MLVGSDKLELDFVAVLPTEKTLELLNLIALTNPGSLLTCSEKHKPWGTGPDHCLSAFLTASRKGRSNIVTPKCAGSASVIAYSLSVI